MEYLGLFTNNYYCTRCDEPTFHHLDVTFFFLNVPKDMDESAMVDGCTRFEAFRYVIVPVMWPGVITTALFSFFLAYIMISQ